MKLVLDPHQEKAVEFSEKNPYNICAVDMGGGKTIIALETQHRARDKGLYVVPSYLIPKWASEIKRFYPNKQFEIASPKNTKIFWDTEIVLISYDSLKIAEPFFEWADRVTFDESQFLKSMKAKRTELAHKLVYENSISRLTLLTGTPVLNRVEEYYSQISLCEYNPLKNGKSQFLEKFPDSITFADYFSYRQQYEIEINGRLVPIIKWDGLRKDKVPELKQWLSPIYLRIKEEEFMKNGRPITIEVPVDYKDRPELDLAWNSFTDGSEGSTNPTAKMESAIYKAPFTVQYVKGLRETVKKVVIFTDHRESCRIIAEAFNIPAIDGSMSPARRFELAQKFQNDPDVGEIVATTGSFSTGLDLFESQDCVFNDENWVPMTNKQAIARLHRKGQKGLVRVHKIFGSIQDEKISKALASKTEVINEVT